MIVAWLTGRGVPASRCIIGNDRQEHDDDRKMADRVDPAEFRDRRNERCSQKIRRGASRKWRPDEREGQAEFYAAGRLQIEDRVKSHRMPVPICDEDRAVMKIGP